MRHLENDRHGGALQVAGARTKGRFRRKPEAGDFAIGLPLSAVSRPSVLVDLAAELDPKADIFIPAGDA
jgi:hypothetical protein